MGWFSGFVGGIINFFVDDILGLSFEQPQTNTNRGQDVSIHSTEAFLPVIKGKVTNLKPTVIAFAGTSGDGTGDDIENDLYHLVFVYGKRVQSIDAVTIGGIDSESEEWQDGDGNKWMHAIKFPNGMDGYFWEWLQAAGFKSDYKFTDCCCVYVVAEAGSEVVTSPPNDVRIDATGLPIISPLDTQSTTGQRYHNNVEHFFHFLTKDTSGPRWNVDKIDVPSWTKAAKDCNILVETFDGSGEYQPRYTFNHAIDTGLALKDNIKIFLESMRAHMPFDHSTGKYHLFVEQDDNYETLEITDSDWIKKRGISTTDSADLGKKVNQVIVQYPDAAQKGKTAEAIYPPPNSEIDKQWLWEDGEPGENPADVISDTRRKIKRVRMDSCDNHYMAMQQAKIEAQHSREGLQVALSVKPRLYSLKPGKVVYVTLRGRWNRKPFRIIGKSLNNDLSSDLALREHQPYIYDYHNTGEKPVIPDTIVNPNKLQKPTDLIVTESAYGGMKATWVSTYARFDWQLEDASGQAVKSDVIQTTSLEFGGLENGKRYVLAIRARNNIGKVSHWVESLPFTYVASEHDETAPDNPLSPVVIAPGIDDPINVGQLIWKVYYDTTDHGEAPDTQASAYGGLIEYRSGQTFTIPDALPATTYFVWFGLVKRDQSNELPKSWVKRTITSGSGLGVEHFQPDLLTSLAPEIIKQAEVPNLPGTLLDVIARLAADIDQYNTLVNEQGSALDAIHAELVERTAEDGLVKLELMRVEKKVGEKTVSAQFQDFQRVAIGYRDDDGNWIEGKPFAQALRETSITTANGDSVSAFVFFQALESAIGDLEGRLTFGVDANGRLTSISVIGEDGEETTSQIILSAEDVLIVDQDGGVLQYWDTVTKTIRRNAKKEVLYNPDTDEPMYIIDSETGQFHFNGALRFPDGNLISALSDIERLAGTIYTWDGNETLPTNATSATALVQSFDSDRPGQAILEVYVFDADGSGINIEFNGVAIANGASAGADGNERVAAFKFNVEVLDGANELKVWAPLTDGTKLRKVVVASGILGEQGPPGVLPSPTGSSGLFADSSHMGYHDGVNWRAYFDDNGRLYLNGENVESYLYFDGSNLELTGNMFLTATDDGGSKVALRFSPGTFYPLWFGAESATVSGANAIFAFDENGTVHAKNMILRALDGSRMFDTTGLYGTWLKELSVDTLKIADNAINVPISLSGPTHLGSNLTLIDTTYNQAQAARVQLNVVVNMIREGDVSGVFDSVDLMAEIYSDSTLVETILHDEVDGDGTNGNNSRKLWPISGSVPVPSSTVRIVIKLISNTVGQNYSAKVSGFVMSAKK